MSFSYERYDRQSRRRAAPSQRTTYGYWIPLGFTVLAATIGLVAWAWKERQESLDDDAEPRDVRRGDASEDFNRPPSFHSELQHGETSYGLEDIRESIEVVDAEQETMMEKMSNTVRKASNPQQIYDGASRQIAAGVAAAGAVLGRGLVSTKEERDDYRDHCTWSEEAETRERMETATPTPSESRMVRGNRRGTGKEKRKMVAVVVSADVKEDWGVDGEEQLYHIAHASALSHLTPQIISKNIQLLVLIYAPHLRSHPLAATPVRSGLQRSSSIGSSISNISIPDGTADPDLATSKNAENLHNPLYEALNSQAQELVDHPTHVLPFTTPTGHIHLLRHLVPSMVYLQETLGGDYGENVEQILGWVGQIVLLVGGEGLGGGLVDTETESEETGPERHKDQGQKWWMDENRVGLGKGIEIVESGRIGEDWAKRMSK